MKLNQVLHEFIQIWILMISNWEKWNGCIFRVIIMWGQGISILWPCKLWWGRATQIWTQSFAGLMTDSLFAHIGWKYIRLRLMLRIQVVTSFEPGPLPYAGTSYQVAISIHLARKVESFWYAVLTVKSNHNEKALELLIFCRWSCIVMQKKNVNCYFKLAEDLGLYINCQSGLTRSIFLVIEDRLCKKGMDIVRFE